MKAIGGITIAGCVLLAAVCVSRAGNGNNAAPPAPTTTPAATQPQKLTLDEVFVAVNATDEEKAQVQELIKHTGEGWCDWVRLRSDDLARTREAYHAAAVSGDAEQADKVWKEYVALVNELPKSSETWAKATHIFSPDQRAA